MDLTPLLDPRSVAIVGASTREAGHAGRCLANLERTGYPGQIFPVNPKYEAIGSRTCYPSVLDIDADADVDAAYLLVPAARVADAVEACAARGVRVAVVCASGFAEVGEDGRRHQERLVAVAREAGMRLLGPNCIGVLNVVDRYIGCPTFNITYTHTPGPISVLSHSGGIASILFNRAQARGIGIRAVVSLGNEADIEMAEVLDALVDDPATRVIALFVEQFRDGDRFVAAAERARAAGKPVAVLKAGRSAAGARSVFGHTGALAGDHAVVSGILRQLGVVEATSIDELLTAAHLLAAVPAPAGGRLGALSPSGGEGGYVADWATDNGLVLPELGRAGREQLADLMSYGTPGNPLDPTGAIIGDPTLLRKVLATFTAEPGFDMISFAIPAWGEFDTEALLPAFVEAAREAGKPAVISMWRARNLTERADQMLRDSGIPAFESSDEAIVALGHLYRYWHRRVTPRSEAPEPRALAAPEPGELTEHEAKRLLGAAGLPVVREAFVADAGDLADAGSWLTGPAVVKLLARGVVHKSDLGLVRLGVTGEAELDAAARELDTLARSQDLEVMGFLVAEQVDGAEIIVGGVRDATFGPLVMIGAGGVYAELFRDVAFRQCPLSPDEVRDALAELRFHAVLAGARGRAYDVNALAETVSEFSRWFAGSPWMREVDLNPVIVRPAGTGGVAIADAAISIGQAG